MLKLSDSTWMQLDCLSVVTAERRAQLGLSDDPTQIFGHHQSSVIAPVSFHEVPRFSRHHYQPFVTKTVTFKRPILLVCKGFV